MSVARFQRVEYALVAAGAAVLAAEKYQLSFANAQQYLATQVALLVCISVLLLLHRTRREISPLYIAALAYISQSAVREPFRWLVEGVLSKVAVAGVVFAAVLVLIFPYPNLSELHGEYKSIGITVGRFGGIECRVLYPSAKAPSTLPPGMRAPFLHHGEYVLKGMSVFSGVPQWIFGCLRSGFLAALPNAPVAVPRAAAGGQKLWPLVIFSHGMGGSIDLYSVVTQQLASEGNVVVVVNHCDGSASVTRTADDRIAYYQKITPEVRDNIDGAGFKFRNGQLRQRVQEVRRVLNAVVQEHKTQVELQQQQTNEPAATNNVFALTDVESVSLVGHSFGAATALTTAHEDERIRALVLLDAWMEPVDEHVKLGLGARVPVIHLLSEHFYKWQANFLDTQTHARGCDHAHSKLTVLLGSRHNNFCDLPVFSPLVNRLMKSAGKIDPSLALHAVSQLSAAFVRGSYAATIAQFPQVMELDAAVATQAAE
ncbi:Platelet-activating factor acetylhydrolase, plasma/intracellular isoform ii protein [Globisporangium polare]